MKLVVIDMGLGNLRSVINAFERVGAEVAVTDSAVEVEGAEAVVLPGVGAFGDGMASLRAHGLIEPLRRHVLERGRPLLGICLGMQLFAEEGTEHGRHEGLKLIRGRVVRLAPTGPGCRLPNMGWCDVTVTNPASRLFAAIPSSERFYFGHGYAVQCADPIDVAATIDYGGPVTAAIERGNLFGVQFHPEKSQDAGLSVLEAFACRTAQAAEAMA